MDFDTLIRLIDRMGGDEYVLGFVFDNSGSKNYTNAQPFNRSLYLDKDTECLFDYDIDTHKNNYTGVKPLSTIQSVLFTDTTKDKDKYNTRYLCG